MPLEIVVTSILTATGDRLQNTVLVLFVRRSTQSDDAFLPGSEGVIAKACVCYLSTFTFQFVVIVVPDYEVFYELGLQIFTAIVCILMFHS